MKSGCLGAHCFSSASRHFSFLFTVGGRLRESLRQQAHPRRYCELNLEAVMSSTAKTIVRAYENYINGQWVKSSSGEMFPVYDPSKEEMIAQVASGTAADVDSAVK